MSSWIYLVNAKTQKGIDPKLGWAQPARKGQSGHAKYCSKPHIF